ncbi:MAG: hypothetical protein MZV63_18785 [Marinilabiliales bacterium]|nr:hypothetical protein [Marinilabiliales bacterium]
MITLEFLAKPVKSDMYRCYIRIDGGLPQQVDEMVKRVIWEIEQDILLLDNRKDALATL